MTCERFDTIWCHFTIGTGGFRSNQGRRLYVRPVLIKTIWGVVNKDVNACIRLNEKQETIRHGGPLRVQKSLGKSSPKKRRRCSLCNKLTRRKILCGHCQVEIKRFHLVFKKEPKRGDEEDPGFENVVRALEEDRGEVS